GMTLPALENRDAILLIGSNVRFSQPLLAHRINKASQEGAHILTINPQKFPLTFPIDRRLITADLVMGLAEVVKAVAEQKQQSLGELKTVAVNKDASIIAEKLLAAEQPAIILGLLANDHPHASQLRALANQLATLLNIPLGSLTHGPNSAGAWIAGMLPHRGVAGEVINTPGLDAKRLLTTDPVKAYLLAGFEVENDCAYSASALTALQQAECVICMAAFSNDAMRDYADFILPLAPHSEYAGTYINVCGEWQSFAAVSAPHHSAKPAWKVFRVLANLLELPGFEFQNEHHVLHEIKQHYDNAATIESNFTLTPPTKLSGTYRLAPWPMYRVDPLVRRAKALQEVMHETPAAVIRVNAKTAVKFNLTAGALASAVQNQQRLSLPVAIDTSLADDVVVLPSGLAETQGFGESFAIMSLESTA
ncbi:MAG: molybdopterin-dependent oxidoreductase, partial [Gammaproteobacteria bacterium]|nr:molybdopterin-dependent oxidoreductase [Gammaproteobacteria bacterium]